MMTQKLKAQVAVVHLEQEDNLNVARFREVVRCPTS